MEGRQARTREAFHALREHPFHRRFSPQTSTGEGSRTRDRCTESSRQASIAARTTTRSDSRTAVASMHLGGAAGRGALLLSLKVRAAPQQDAGGCDRTSTHASDKSLSVSLTRARGCSFPGLVIDGAAE